MWLVVHLTFMTGFKNRFLTIFYWLFSFIGHGRTERALLPVAPAVDPAAGPRQTARIPPSSPNRQGAPNDDSRPRAGNADALVIFGISGDLARVMTFRSLYRLERRGLLDCPIVGVAVDDWSVDDLREHARAAIVATGEPLDEAVFERFAARLSYLQGDFNDDGHVQRRGEAARRAPRCRSSTSRSRRSCSARSSGASRRPG